MVIEFDEMPESIKAIFRSRKADCSCQVRVDREGREAYYVRLDDETSRFTHSRKSGWTHMNSFQS